MPPCRCIPAGLSLLLKVHIFQIICQKLYRRRTMNRKVWIIAFVHYFQSFKVSHLCLLFTEISDESAKKWETNSIGNSTWVMRRACQRIQMAVNTPVYLWVTRSSPSVLIFDFSPLFKIVPCVLHVLYSTPGYQKRQHRLLLLLTLTFKMFHIWRQLTCFLLRWVYFCLREAYFQKVCFWNQSPFGLVIETESSVNMLLLHYWSSS